jgi:hypothetical protein
VARTDTAEIIRSINDVKRLRAFTLTLADHLKVLAERLQKVEKRLHALEAPRGQRK